MLLQKYRIFLLKNKHFFKKSLGSDSLSLQSINDSSTYSFGILLKIIMTSSMYVDRTDFSKGVPQEGLREALKCSWSITLDMGVIPLSKVC
jgi:hypothetical protein